jgi:hypothetical protein
MTAYSFVTRWRLQAPLQAVWDALYATDRYTEWWPSIVEYKKLTPEITGIGARAQRAVRGRLPYTLRYTTTVTNVDPLRELAYDSEGDLVGKGRFVLTQQGEWTEVVFYWDVSTRSYWMNLLAPLLGWLFAWNHHYVMAQGERGLAAWLTDRRPSPEHPVKSAV